MHISRRRRSHRMRHHMWRMRSRVQWIIMRMWWHLWWRRGLLFLLLVNIRSRYNRPHPALSITLDLRESIVLTKIVSDTTLPSNSTTFQHKIWIFSCNGAIYLWQRHFALWSSFERIEDKLDVVLLWLGQLLGSEIGFVENGRWRSRTTLLLLLLVLVVFTFWSIWILRLALRIFPLLLIGILAFGSRMLPGPSDWVLALLGG